MAPAPARLLRPLILVVDDDDVTRRVVQIILKSHGFRVFLASTWQDAIRICSRFGRRIDLVIAEVGMPGMSGFDLAERVGEVAPGVPVLLMSGSFLREGTVVHRIEPGTAFLAKPFTQDLLLSKLQVLMTSGGWLSARSAYGAN